MKYLDIKEYDTTPERTEEVRSEISKTFDIENEATIRRLLLPPSPSYSTLPCYHSSNKEALKQYNRFSPNFKKSEEVSFRSAGKHKKLIYGE